MAMVHEMHMRRAIRQAQQAAEEGEVPTGCVIVSSAPTRPGESPILGQAHNQVELLKDPTAHAEILAITQAASARGDWRLIDTVLYVTKEPCVMCAGAIVMARIPLVVRGAADIQRGAAISAYRVLDDPRLNHRAEVVPGVLAEECRTLLQEFFRERRAEKNPG